MEKCQAASRVLRILVVDDNADAADSLARLLKHVGHDARVAYRGKAALEEAHEHSPDVIFVDLMMPGFSGYDLADSLREQKTVLVAITGLPLADLDGCDKFDYVLTKPAKIDTLLTMLEEIAKRGPAGYADQLMHEPALLRGRFIQG